MALCYIGKYDVNLKKKIFLWKRFISAKKEDLKLKYYERLLRFKKEEESIIVIALEKLEEQSGKDKEIFGSLYRPFSIGMSAYEFIYGE
jgi:uncharacterized protein YaaW (UPF0174 family)